MRLNRLQKKREILPGDIDKLFLTLPDTLDSMYDAMFHDLIDEDHYDIVFRILRWLVVSYQMLYLADFSELSVISVSSDLESDSEVQNRCLTPDNILGLLQGIVSIKQIDGSTSLDPRDCYLVFSHFSVREYLTRRQPLHSSREIGYQGMRVDIATAHRLVAQECLAYRYHRYHLFDSKFLHRYINLYWSSHCVPAIRPWSPEAERLYGEIESRDFLELVEDLPAEFDIAIDWLKDRGSLFRLLLILRNDF